MRENFLETINIPKGYNDETGEIYFNKIKEIENALEIHVNVFGYNPEKVYKEFREKYGESASAYAINKMFIIALHWIYFYGNVPTWDEDADNNHYHKSVDGRNEISVKVCEDISHMAVFQKLMKFYCEIPNYNESRLARNSELGVNTRAYMEFMRCVNEKMHKTNVQTAASLMLYALSQVTDRDAIKIVEYLKEKRGDRYYSFPMI